jgi:hypothetical protein
MPVIAIKIECDLCHKTFKGVEDVALLRDAKLACRTCAVSINPDRIYTWFSPIEAIKTTKKPLSGLGRLYTEAP